MEDPVLMKRFVYNLPSLVYILSYHFPETNSERSRKSGISMQTRGCWKTIGAFPSHDRSPFSVVPRDTFVRHCLWMRTARVWAWSPALASERSPPCCSPRVLVFRSVFRQCAGLNFATSFPARRDPLARLEILSRPARELGPRVARMFLARLEFQARRSARNFNMAWN